MHGRLVMRDPNVLFRRSLHPVALVPVAALSEDHALAALCAAAYEPQGSMSAYWIGGPPFWA